MSEYVRYSCCTARAEARDVAHKQTGWLNEAENKNKIKSDGTGRPLFSSRLDRPGPDVLESLGWKPYIQAWVGGW